MSETWTADDIAAAYAFMKDSSRRWDQICIQASQNTVQCSYAGHVSKVGHPLSHTRTNQCVNPVTLVQPWDIAGHMDRESGLYFWEKYPDGQVKGDDGNALGVLQINALYHASVAGLGLPSVNIPLGTLLLCQGGDWLALQPIPAADSAAAVAYVDQTASYFAKLRLGYYNAGTHALTGLGLQADSDWFTAPGGKMGKPPGDYGADVLNRAAAFQPLFEADMQSAA